MLPWIIVSPLPTGRGFVNRAWSPAPRRDRMHGRENRLRTLLPLTALWLLFGAGMAASNLHAQTPGPAAPATGGWIEGTIVDGATGQVVPAVQLRLREVGRSELSHSDGSFHFDALLPGRYTLVSNRVGYAPVEVTVQVVAGDTVEIPIELVASVIDLPALVVTGVGSERRAGESYRPTSVLADAELRRRMSGSVAATLAGQAGISQRYNGPAASQPVIRGLSGDRVLMLEDGQRTGDLASTSSDHSVTIDPLTAAQIEVVRGPAGLIYGSNALGGVINVIREEVPQSVPDRLTGLVTTQLESVNRGAAGGVALTVPLGSFALRGEASARTAGNTQTPLGELPTTYLDGYNAGLAGSWIGSLGYIGLAGRSYGMGYGVPGVFNGQVIPGGHEGGVEIQVDRTTARLEGALTSGMGPFSSIDLDASYVRYDQDEIELEEGSGGVVGTRFRQYSQSGELIGRHGHELGGFRVRGAVGLWAMQRSFSTAGLRTGSAPADQLSIAGFGFEEFALDPFSFEVGGRYDWTRIAPLEQGEEEIGVVRDRTFGSLSASASALIEFVPGWTAGIGVSRSVRTPAIEELFSNGPHLANYSFDIGNPDLRPEVGFGTDLFVRAALSRLNGELSFYRNRISDYIYHAPTGRLDPRQGIYPVYQAAQADALFRGFDGRAQWEIASRWVLDGTASYVHGEQSLGEGDTPLPEIPPFHGSLGLRHDATRYFAGITWESGARQDRVPPAPAGATVPNSFDQPTAGYNLVHGVAGVRWTLRGQLHSLTLQLNNALDTEWRDHLSRIKPVAPQPGRNIQLLYRVDF